MSPTGERTPEDAARGDVPPRFVQVIAVVVRDDQAIVAQLMNDIPPHEVETAFCFREPDGSLERHKIPEHIRERYQAFVEGRRQRRSE